MLKSIGKQSWEPVSVLKKERNATVERKATYYVGYV